MAATVATSTIMFLTKRNAGDEASPRSLAGSLVAEVRLGGIRGAAVTSGTGAIGTGMSRQGAAVMTAAVAGAVLRDVAVATGTRDEEGRACMLYDRRFSKLERCSLLHFEQKMITREMRCFASLGAPRSLTLARRPSLHCVLHCK